MDKHSHLWVDDLNCKRFFILFFSRQRTTVTAIEMEDYALAPSGSICIQVNRLHRAKLGYQVTPRIYTSSLMEGDQL
jgi:hypothetical protein